LPETTVISYYYHHAGTLITVNARKHGPFRTVDVTGQTPSGLALLATAKTHPDSFIIHFTDGNSNTGPSPEQVFPIIEREFPAVKIMEVRYRQRRYSSNQQSLNTWKSLAPNVQAIYLNNVADFPIYLKEALKPWYLG